MYQSPEKGFSLELQSCELPGRMTRNLFLQFLQNLNNWAPLQAALGMVAHACNPKTQQVEEELPQLWNHLSYSKTVSKPKQNPTKTKLHKKIIVELGRPWKMRVWPQEFMLNKNKANCSGALVTPACLRRHGEGQANQLVSVHAR